MVIGGDHGSQYTSWEGHPSPDQAPPFTSLRQCGPEGRLSALVRCIPDILATTALSAAIWPKRGTLVRSFKMQGMVEPRLQVSGARVAARGVPPVGDAEDQALEPPGDFEHLYLWEYRGVVELAYALSGNRAGAEDDIHRNPSDQPIFQRPRLSWGRWALGEKQKRIWSDRILIRLICGMRSNGRPRGAQLMGLARLTVAVPCGPVLTLHMAATAPSSAGGARDSRQH
jgi:hypothetical protein